MQSWIYAEFTERTLELRLYFVKKSYNVEIVEKLVLLVS